MVIFIDEYSCKLSLEVYMLAQYGTLGQLTVFPWCELVEQFRIWMFCSSAVPLLVVYSLN